MASSIVVGLFLAFVVAWTGYPRFCLPRSVRFFFFACPTAGPGFAQLRFSRRFHRDSSKILLRVFLFAGLVMIVGLGTLLSRIAFGQLRTIAWTSWQRSMEIGTTLFRLGAWSGFGVTLLNSGYGSVRRRRV
jgi:hypothetical protein